MTTRLRWKRLPNGHHMCTTLPIVLERSGRAAPILVKTPLEPEHSSRDGWAWRAVVDTDASGRVEFWNLPDAKAWVADNLDMIAGQTDPAHGPDMALYEAWAVEDAALTERIRENYRAPSTPREGLERLDASKRSMIRTAEHVIASSRRQVADDALPQGDELVAVLRVRLANRIAERKRIQADIDDIEKQLIDLGARYAAVKDERWGWIVRDTIKGGHLGTAHDPQGKQVCVPGGITEAEARAYADRLNGKKG